MRRAPTVSALAIVAFLLSAGLASADIPDPGMPKYANNILADFVTPVVRPGDTVYFSFNVSNPYGWNETMSNVTLAAGVYRYATQEKTVNVTESFENPPLIHGASTTWYEYIGSLGVNESIRVELDIETSRDTPHGSYFSQSTYFVRFNMTFNLEGNSTKVVLSSRGWFTDEQWDEMVSFEGNESILNRTYMKSLGVDGLLPDSAFGIKIPIPRWPLWTIVGVAAFLCFMAAYYYVLDNPGKYPRLEKRFYYLRGKLRELRGKPKH